jgi:hypothetical protein
MARRYWDPEVAEGSPHDSLGPRLASDTFTNKRILFGHFQVTSLAHFPVFGATKTEAPTMEKDPYRQQQHQQQAIWKDASSRFYHQEGGANKDEGSWFTVLFWTAMLGLVGVWWYRQQQQQQSTNNPQSAKELSNKEKERRAQVTAARLRALQVHNSSTKTNPDAIIKVSVSAKATTTPKTVRSSVDMPSTEAASSSARDGIPRAKEEQKEVLSKEKQEEEPSTVVPSLKKDNNYESKPPISPSKKKKKRQPPPVQMVCEALSTVLPVSLQVEDCPEANSWGGIGWWKHQQQSTTTQSSVVITLHTQFDPPKEDDWNYLCSCLERLLPYDQILPNDLGLRPMILVYSKLESLCQTGHMPFLLPGRTPSFESFRELCQGLQKKVVKRIVSKIDIAGAAVTTNPAATFIFDEEEEEEDLFSDDYYDQSIATTNRVNTVIISKSSASPSSSPSFDTFMELLVKDNLVSLQLLQRLIEHSDDLSNRILTRILEVLQQSVFPITKLQPWLELLSNFTKVLAPFWTQHLEHEVLALQRKDDVDPAQSNIMNGRKMEERLLFFTPVLFQMAALALEPHDEMISNQNAQPTTARLTRHFTDISKFPICVFQHPQSPEISQTVQSFRHISIQAQRITESWIRIAMKESDKELVFQWVRLVISEK